MKVFPFFIWIYQFFSYLCSIKIKINVMKEDLILALHFLPEAIISLLPIFLLVINLFIIISTLSLLSMGYIKRLVYINDTNPNFIYSLMSIIFLLINIGICIWWIEWLAGALFFILSALVMSIVFIINLIQYFLD